MTEVTKHFINTYLKVLRQLSNLISHPVAFFQLLHQILMHRTHVQGCASIPVHVHNRHWSLFHALLAAVRIYNDSRKQLAHAGLGFVVLDHRSFFPVVLAVAEVGPRQAVGSLSRPLLVHLLDKFLSPSFGGIQGLTTRQFTVVRALPIRPRAAVYLHVPARRARRTQQRAPPAAARAPASTQVLSACTERRAVATAC